MGQRLEKRRKFGVGVSGHGKGRQSEWIRSRLQVSNHFIWGSVICGHSCLANAQVDGKSRRKLTNISCVSIFSLLRSGQDGSSQRPTPTRIPMSKGMKAGKPVVAAPGAGNLTKFEPRAETQSMKIELKKSAAGSATSLGGGKG